MGSTFDQRIEMTPRSCSAPSHWKNSRRAVNIAAVWHPCAHACCSAALFSERTDTLMQWSVERRVCRVTQASPAKVGGARRDRTADLLHAMQALSQLSYGPETSLHFGACSALNFQTCRIKPVWLEREADNRFANTRQKSHLRTYLKSLHHRRRRQ